MVYCARVRELEVSMGFIDLNKVRLQQAPCDTTSEHFLLMQVFGRELALITSQQVDSCA